VDSSLHTAPFRVPRAPLESLKSRLSESVLKILKQSANGPALGIEQSEGETLATAAHARCRTSKRIQPMSMAINTYSLEEAELSAALHFMPQLPPRISPESNAQIPEKSTRPSS